MYTGNINHNTNTNNPNSKMQTSSAGVMPSGGYEGNNNNNNSNYRNYAPNFNSNNDQPISSQKTSSDFNRDGIYIINNYIIIKLKKICGGIVGFNQFFAG